MKKNKTKKIIFESLPAIIIFVFATGTFNAYAWSGSFQSDSDSLMETQTNNSETDKTNKNFSADKQKNHEAIRMAIENNDFSVLKKLTSERILGNKIPDEKTFAKLVEARGIRMQGNFKRPRAMMQEVGFRPQNNSPTSLK